MEPHFRQIHWGIVVHGKLQCNLMMETANDSVAIASQLYLILLGLTVLDIGEGNFKGVVFPHLGILNMTTLQVEISNMPRIMKHKCSVTSKLSTLPLKLATPQFQPF